MGGIYDLPHQNPDFFVLLNQFGWSFRRNTDNQLQFNNPKAYPDWFTNLKDIDDESPICCIMYLFYYFFVGGGGIGSFKVKRPYIELFSHI